MINVNKRKKKRTETRTPAHSHTRTLAEWYRPVKNIRLIVVITLYLGLLALVACEREPVPQPPGTLSPTPASTIAVTEAPATTPTAEITTPAATIIAETETPIPTPTSLPPTPTAVPDTPTAEPSPMPSATATLSPAPSPTPSPTLSPTTSPTVQPVTPATFAPGQSDTTSLALGEFNVYTFNAAALEPILIFVETGDRLDTAISIYAATIAAAADLETLTPLAQADANADGGPEILTFVPGADGAYSLVLRASETAGNGTGEYTIHMFDMETTTAAVAIQESGTLAAAAINTYTVQSNGSRPLLLWLNPAGQADLIVRVIGENGNLIVEGNFSGPGAVESVYILPRQTTTYTIEVLETSGAPATYDIMIVTLE